jgi:putative heme-binding domain-containing protein
MKDGRVLSGFISTQNDQTLTLRTMTSTETLPKADMTKTEASSQSLMPEGILDTLTPQQRRDLFGFLMKK